MNTLTMFQALTSKTCKITLKSLANLSHIPTQSFNLFPLNPSKSCHRDFAHRFTSQRTLSQCSGYGIHKDVVLRVSLGLSWSIRTNCCNMNAPFVQPPRLSFFSAKPRSIKALKSLPLSRKRCVFKWVSGEDRDWPFRQPVQVRYPSLSYPSLHRHRKLGGNN